MTQKEARLALVDQVLDGQMAKAGPRRSIARFGRKMAGAPGPLGGAADLISRRRGVPGNRRIDAAVREHFMVIVRERYSDFGNASAREYLAQDLGVWAAEG